MKQITILFILIANITTAQDVPQEDTIQKSPYPIAIFDPVTQDSLMIMEAWMMRYYMNEAEENPRLRGEIIRLYKSDTSLTEEIALLEKTVEVQASGLNALALTNQKVVGDYAFDTNLKLSKILGGQNQINDSIIKVNNSIDNDPKWKKWLWGVLGFLGGTGGGTLIGLFLL